MRGWGDLLIAPEKLLRALLLQVLYSVRSERLLMEELDYNMLFRWFVGLNMDDRVWDRSEVIVLLDMFNPCVSDHGDERHQTA
jgi:transposase